MRYADKNERQDTMVRRGAIVKHAGVWMIECGECHRDDPVADTTNATRSASEQGWKYTGESGWVCPTCKRLPRLKYNEQNRETSTTNAGF